MNRRRYPCIYVLLLFFIVGPNQLPSLSDDWPMFGRDATRNAVSPEKDPPGPHAELDACMRVDCIGAQSITNKVYRGGAWNENAGALRSANRRDSHFQLRPEGTGFRCAKPSR